MLCIMGDEFYEANECAHVTCPANADWQGFSNKITKRGRIK